MVNNLTYEMSKFFLPILKNKSTLSKLKDVSNNQKLQFRCFRRLINNSSNQPIQLYNLFENNIVPQIVNFLFSLSSLQTQ